MPGIMLLELVTDTCFRTTSILLSFGGILMIVFLFLLSRKSSIFGVVKGGRRRRHVAFRLIGPRRRKNLLHDSPESSKGTDQTWSYHHPDHGVWIEKRDGPFVEMFQNCAMDYTAGRKEVCELVVKTVEYYGYHYGGAIFAHPSGREFQAIEFVQAWKILYHPVVRITYAPKCTSEAMAYKFLYGGHAKMFRVNADIYDALCDHLWDCTGKLTVAQDARSEATVYHGFLCPVVN